MITLWGHGNCAGIPNLSSYDEAKKHYETVVPIRRRSEIVKPLGRNRRFNWYQITEHIIAIQSENREYKTYGCRLYNDFNPVEFYPNGDIVINTGRWRSITTGMFINSVINGFGNIVSDSGKWYFKNQKGETYFLGQIMRIRKNEEGVFMPTEIVPDVVHRTNRKVLNALRKKYKSIVEYGKGMLAMTPEVTTVEDLEMARYGLTGRQLTPYYHWQTQETVNNRAKWFDLADKQLESGDLELLYFLASFASISAGTYNWRTETHTCSPEKFASLIDEMIKYNFRQEIFYVEPVPVGSSHPNRNKKYFHN